MEYNNCKNCKEQISVDWEYCPICGRPAILKRIDMHYIVQEIADFFFANKGLVYTIKNVLINPGDSVRQFIAEDRHRFMKPITFLVITTLIYALVSHLFNVKLDDVFVIEGVAISPIQYWIMENPRYTNTIVVLFVALWVKIFFKKTDYNFFEIFILMCFICGITTLIDTVLVVIQGVSTLNIISASICITAIYQTWAIGHFFDKNKAASYAKAFLSFIFGVLNFAFLVTVATIIEVLIKTLN